MKLVIGDKNYSSWSMRPWVLMKHFGIPFEEVVVRLGEPDTRTSILEHSPSGRVPCLVMDNGASVWESVAILETLAEHFPDVPMWPRDAAARAHARSVSAEMHAGFAELRTNMWMNIRASFPGKGATPGALADIARIEALWSACLDQYGGPFLFGEFTIADAMYAPVVMRFNTWRPALSEAAAAYARRLTDAPAVQAWIADAMRETHTIDYYETPA
ncbi:glutathione S-transferase family protein [Paraburkholderia sp. SOS3]|jgi:glutathione S-transferase|uniref:glutathione S-transferase family protein n=1 Tax=Paraburkholderia sp. SOS3 TaxID=1926494 RepID=UPI000947393D|nr:glutathione S-transferase family protein [Paraburkholderia sp. SOS3]APR37250.1 glutathione S-transferase [Paraburkholderia sp. SOS3]